MPQSSFTRIARTIRLVFAAEMRLTAVSSVLQILQGIVPMAALLLLKRIIDSATMAISAPDPTSAFHQTLGWLIAAGAVAVVGLGLQALGQVVTEIQAQSVRDYVQSLIHKKSVFLDLAYYEDPRYFDTLHRAQRDGSSRPVKMTNSVASMVQNGVSLIAMVSLLATFSYWMSLLLLIAVLPGVWAKWTQAGITFRSQRRNTALEREANFYDWLMTGIQYAAEVRVFDLGTLLRSRFDKSRAALRRERIALTRHRAIMECVTQSGGTLVVFAAFGFVIYRTVTGMITLGDMVIYYQAFQRGLGYLRSTLGAVTNLYEDSLFVRDLFDFLDQKGVITVHPDSIALPENSTRTIRLTDVTFYYPGGKVPAVSHVSLALPPGSITALVGANGSGKSTLTKLICRLYDPAEGAIELDGTDIRRFDPRDYRRMFAITLQDYGRYPISLRDNVIFGDTASPFDESRMKDAAAKSGADSIAKSLPSGYDSVLGRWFDGGSDLSSGQWQKIAIARAFYRNAPILILDEPSSALDPQAEAELFDRFRALTDGRTAIIISHRFSTVRAADHIVVMDNGTVIEQGSHRELMKLEGRYAHLFRLQSAGYVDGDRG